MKPHPQLCFIKPDLVHTVNFALFNSGIYHKSVRFVVEPYNFDFPSDPIPDFGHDLFLFRNDQLANDRRIANRADLMFLLTDSRYLPILCGTYTAEGTILPYLGIVSMEYLSGPWFAFAHEMGHTFLLNHNRVSNMGDYPGSGVPGAGPYNIRWGVCAAEFPTSANPMVPLGFGNTLIINSGTMPLPEFWLFLFVTSPEGVFVNDVIRVSNPCGKPAHFVRNRNGLKEQGVAVSQTQEFELSPNPATQNLRIQFLEPASDDKASFSIFNSLGEIVSHGIAKLGLQNNLDIDLRSKTMPDGFYYLHLSAGSFSGVQKFIIQR